MVKMPDDIEDIINNETKRGNKIIPFLGSAASLFEPTNLPSWNNFIKKILSSLERKLPKELKIELTDKVLNLIWQGNIPAYEITEIIAKRLGIEYLKVINSLAGHQSNEFHEWIVEGMIQRKFPIIITTNFDNNVEQLLINHGLKPVYLTGNTEKDKIMLDLQLKEKKTDNCLNVVIVDNVDAFKFLAKNTGWIGLPNHTFILKVHGDALYPNTCVDTMAQRLQGLSSSVGHILSVLLQQYPFFFLGFGGGDLETGLNYLRLESERDLANIYWLIRKQDPIPQIFKKIETRLGGSFKIIKGSIPGKISQINPSLEKMINDWADKIGEFWASLVLLDLSQKTGMESEHKSIFNNLSLIYGIPKMTQLIIDKSSSYNLNYSKYIFKQIKLQKENSKSSLYQLEISKSITNAITEFRNNSIKNAINEIKNAILLTRKYYEDLRKYPDSWIPTAIYGIFLYSLNEINYSKIFLDDAKDIANLIGSQVGQNFMNNIYEIIEFSKLNENFNKRKDIDNNEFIYSPPDENDILISIPAFDNVGEFFEGIPESIYLKAELNRGLLVGDKLVLTPNFLLNSRVFITEILFTDDQLNKEYLYFIRPLLPRIQNIYKNGKKIQLNLIESEDPILIYREECQVNNKGFFHEKIDIKYFNKINDFYKKHRELIYWYDFNVIAGFYGNRTKSILENPIPKEIFPQELQEKANEIKSIMLDYVKVCLEKDDLTRTLLYQFSNLFRYPTSNEDFREVINKLVDNNDQNHKFSKEILELIDKRKILVSQPWNNSEIMKLFSDAAYITNLPIAFGFSLTLNEDEKNHYKLIENVLKKEKKLLAN